MTATHPIAFPMRFPLILGEEEGFTWWGLINPAWKDVPHYLIMGWVVAITLTLLSALVKVSLSHGDPVIPKDPAQMGLADWIRQVFESIVSAMVDLVDSLMPHHREGRQYLWLVAPIFLYILLGNLMALVPGFQPATNSVNTNFAVAITVFVLYNAYGVKSSGIGYLRHFWAPKGLFPWWAFPATLALGLLLAFIELFSHAFRPLTLTLRLFGNMTGDHAAFSTFLNLVPIGVPIIFLLLGVLVSLIQAYVFTLLSAIYFALATSHDH